MTTTGTQTYQDAVTLSADVTLTTTDSNVVFGSTVNSSATTGAPSVTLQDTNHGWSSLTVSGTAGEETSFDINYPGFGNDRYDTVILGANSTIKLYANGGFEPLITTITNNTNSAVTNNFGDVGLSSFKLSGSGSSSSNNRTLTINTGGNTDVIQFSGTIGDSASLGAISITGVLDLDAAITSAASLSVSGTANLGADVTTSGNQTYSGAVILSTNVSLSGGNQLLFGGTVNSSDTDSTSDARTLTTTFTETELDGIVGGTYALGAMDINGALDLDAAISGAASMDVSGTANLGADVTTSGNQTYSGAVILSTNVSLSGGNQLLFGGTVNSSDTDSTSDARTLTTTFTENGIGWHHRWDLCLRCNRHQR